MGVPAGRDRNAETPHPEAEPPTLHGRAVVGAGGCCVLVPTWKHRANPPPPPPAFFAQGAVGRMDEDVRETVLITDPTAFKSLGSKYGRGKRNGEDDWYELALLSSSRVLHLT